MALDLQINRDFTVGPTGAFWTDDGIARLAAAGVEFSLDHMPQVHRLVGGEALDAVFNAMTSSWPDVPVFSVPPSVAATLRAGEHYDRSGCGITWSQTGLAALRAAGWDGSLRSEPTVEEALGSRLGATARSHRVTPPAAPTVASTPSPVSRMTPQAPLPSSAPAPAPSSAKPVAVLDLQTIMKRSQLGHAAYAKTQPTGSKVRPEPTSATTMAEASLQFWARYRLRQAAGLCPLNGTPKAEGRERRSAGTAPPKGGIDHKAIMARLAKAENREFDLDDIYARRRQAAKG